MTKIHYLSALKLAEKIRSRKIGAVELLDHFLKRIEKYNPRLNAIIWLDADRARESANKADKALMQGDFWGPLHGVPMTVKEAFNFIGSPTTWGKPEFKNNISSANAVVIDKLLNAGAIIFGKTNVPVDLADWQSFNPIYGTTNNPWNVELTPGGSSGGSAAALAAGLTGLEVGSDIGASIRNPAHYCGIFGHKPTSGIISGEGYPLPGILKQADISVVGPMARSAEDLDLALDILAGPGTFDSPFWKLELPPPRHKRLEDYRVAVMLSDPVAEVDISYQHCLSNIADELIKRGAKVSLRARPEINTNQAFEVYISLLRAATSRAASEKNLLFFSKVVSGGGIDRDSYLFRMARAVQMSHLEWLKLDNERERLRSVWKTFFQEWDILLCPAATSAAWPHDQNGERHDRTILVNGKEQPTTDQLFWAGFSNMVYLPSTVSPAGFSAERLPLGLQAIAGFGEDRTSIEFCRLVASEIQGFKEPSGYD